MEKQSLVGAGPACRIDTSPNGQSVPALFAAQTRRTPAAAAVSLGDRVLTYLQLDAKAGALALRLRERGVGRGSLIGICADRSLEMIVGLLAIGKAGGAYVPLDPTSPAERLAFLAADSGISLVLSPERCRDRLLPELPWVALDGREREASAQGRGKVTEAAGGDLACVLYTSGSTGSPKGVEILHSGIARLVAGADYIRFEEARTFLQLAPLSFDASTFEIWGPLLNGGRCVLYPDPFPTPRRLGEVLRHEQVDTLWLTASLFNTILDEAPQALAGVRQLLIGGESLSVRHVTRALHLLPHTEIVNGYGPTECTTFACTYRIPRDFPDGAASVPIGKPIARTEALLLDSQGRPVPEGTPGELFLGGDGLARGYRGRADLTAARFVPHPLSASCGERVYRTGDMARRRPDGNLEYLGRTDRQVKIRGHRIEPEEVEAALARHPGVKESAVAVCGEGPEKNLTAWVAAAPKNAPDRKALRAFLAQTLPPYMLPSSFLFLETLPKTAAGKIDRQALPTPERRRPSLARREGGRTESERQVARLWSEVLGIPSVGLRENFFDLGGHSLHLMQVHTRLCGELGIDLPAVKLFELPTVSALAEFLEDLGGRGSQHAEKTSRARFQPEDRRLSQRDGASDGIAIIGMAGRFPGAADVDHFWANLVAGRESISRFSDEDLRAAGIDETLLARPDYVRARAILEDADRFDASFFGITPREAELMDPQHRVFLEVAHDALERAGYDPERTRGAIGVYAGLSLNTYLLANLGGDRRFLEELVGSYQSGAYYATLGNDKDYLPTRVSYKLNLRGPSLTVATACSTSLAAVALACQSLWQGQCDMALAGGVSISFPQKRGYLAQDGGMVSPDGRCRPFDANASGTVFGGGVGIVVLKRLADALADGDAIAAVIRGAALNNDGSSKVGYTAPSVEAQASVIAAAQDMAGFPAGSISYVEGHGTGTSLGDPIEVSALTRAFRRDTAERGFCALGSVKGNVGHLEAAAGVTGLIKTALAFQHGLIPGTLHYERPNPKLELERSPFFVSAAPRPWKNAGFPRRAGVSSFGVGGTNVHVVLEEAPPSPAPSPSRPAQLLLLSARTPSALEAATENLRAHLLASPGLDLADAAHTLRIGRRAFPHRRMVLCEDLPGAAQALGSPDGKRVADALAPEEEREVVFLFPGQGAQFVNMGRGLYEQEPDFRSPLDECAEGLAPLLGFDPRPVLYPESADLASAVERLEDIALAQPLLFAVEYSLARLWMTWGVRPRAMLGHSVGEYVAACLAGVFSLEDALTLLAERGRLVQSLPAGAMLAVRLSPEQIAPWLSEGLSLAAVNAPGQVVVSGTPEAVQTLDKRLSGEGIATRRLRSTRAFHSAMLDPVLGEFERVVSRAHPAPPRIPFLSNVTGTWIREEEATDPEYWARHLRQTVRFSEGLEELLSDPGRVFLEVGPGQTLSSLARQRARRPATPVLPPPGRGQDANLDQASVIETLGRLWVAGATVNWEAFSAHERRRRVPLPTYPFERKSFWIEPSRGISPVEGRREEPPEQAPVVAKPTAPSVAAAANEERVLAELGKTLADLSGLPAEGLERGASFLEMGLDSLFLTQASQAFTARFGVKVTFRELLDEHATLESLAAHISRALPPLSPEEAPTAASEEKALAVRVEALEKLVAQRLGAAPPLAVAAPERKGSFTAFGPYKPIQKDPAGGLTPRQARSLEDLIARYTRRTRESKSLTQDNRSHFADPRVAAGFRLQWKEMVYPIVVNRSAGARIWDVDGNEYVDLLNGFGLNLFGHSPAFVTKAVSEQLERGIEIGPQSPAALEVAAAIAEMTGMERVTFCNTGSEAVMAALRLARTVTGRKKIALFSGAYHGTFDEVLVRGIVRNGVRASLPIAPGIPEEKVANVIVLEYGSEESLRVLESEMESLAAVLVEPVQSRHPDLQPRAFLQALREMTRRCGTALIFDEVITGFRVHPGGAQAWFDVRADLATYGKVIGGGMPIGALAGTRAFMDALDGGMWEFGDASFPETGVTFFAGTFVRHPIAMAAASAVLEHLRREGPSLQERLNERSERFAGSLNQLFQERGVAIHMQRFGSIFYFSLPAEQKLASLLYYLLREKGVHILEGFPFFLTTAHSDADLEFILRAFRDSLVEMQEADFLPGTEAGRSEASPVALEDTRARVPLTEAQKEVWLAAQMGDDASCAFNESVTLTLTGALDPELLGRALSETVARHDALRARFDPSGETQTFAPETLFDLPLLDLTTDPPEARTERTAALIAEEARVPFSLEKGPLLRGRLVKLEEQRHLLLLTAHHLVCDGWSTNVLLAETAASYSAQRSGEERALPAASAFADYAAEENAETEESARAESYWLNRFATPPSPLELPLDRPRPPVKSDRGATERRVLSSGLAREVRRAGAREGCTLFTTLLGAFEALLHRLTGQEDLVVGVPAAGQARTGRKDLVGHCVNFLPLRSAVSSGASFREHLRRTRTRVLEAYEHQSYTYGRLVRRLGLPRDPSRLPLLEAWFNVERLGGKEGWEGLDVEIDQNPKAFVNFDLFFNVVEAGDRLLLDCDYNADLFDADTVRRWLSHYETLLASAVEEPGQSLAALPLMEGEERQRLIAGGNATDAPFPPVPVPRLIEAQAERSPDRVALVFGEKELTYRDFNGRANQLARTLLRAGAQPGDPVGLCLERSPEMVIGLLAILKAGAAYVPLDPAYPAERKSFILEDAGVRTVVTRGALGEGLTGRAIRALCLDAKEPAISRESSSDLGVTIFPESLAYIIYTSGSTGKPKGVEVPHRAVSNLIHAMWQNPGFTERDSLLAMTTISFDIAALEWMLPLASGGCVILASREAAADGGMLKELLKASGATVLQATPSTWQLLLAAGWEGDRRLTMLCGGEAISRPLARALAGRGGRLWNMYGPTETTIWSAAGRVEGADGGVPLGPPIANTRLHVLDSRLEPAPPGVAGELFVAGRGLARGYRGHPEWTAERFLPDPFAADPGSRLYRTGDLVRRRPDRAVEFLGRRDDQVKLRGFRIELSEVEDAIRAQPGISDCAVALREDAPGERRLVAYVVPAGEGPDADTDTSSEAMDAPDLQTVHWKTQWEMLYREAIAESAGEIRSEDPTLAILRWTQNVERPEEELREWVEQTVERVLALHPKRVLEIGCGTGALLFRLAPHCVEFRGTDYSEEAVAYLRQEIARRVLPQVSVSTRLADDFRGLPKGGFDTILINSVVQYFPGADYLMRVLEGALEALAPGGTIFVGDVQSFPLLTTYHTAAQLSRAPASLPTEHLRQRVKQRMALENELVVDPELFFRFAHAFPRITRTQALLRRGRLSNETTQFHYDVLLTAGDRTVPEHSLPVLDWIAEGLTPSRLKEALSSAGASVRVTRVPNGRIQQERRAAELLSRPDGPKTVGELREALRDAPPGVDPESAWALAAELSGRAELELSPGGDPYRFDILFSSREARETAGTAAPRLPGRPKPWSAYANDPLKGITLRRVVAKLRHSLSERLPDYMVPSLFEVLEALPRTQNGKVDRKALPPPDAEARHGKGTFVAPRGPRESALAEIWAEVLHLDRVGAEDDIFDLGGDSLLIFQITARAGDKGLALTPRQVFQHRTIAALCALESRTEAEEPRAPELTPLSREAHRMSRSSL